jgi:ParB family chromosome partitioning protein
MGFNMLELLNNSSEENKKSEKIARFKTIQINVNDLIPSGENFYSTDEEELKSLKDSIEIFGVQQNLVVKRVDGGKYEIIAGHRRYLALKKLVEEGKQQFEYAPCKVEIEEDSIKDKLLLLITNSTARQLTDWEKTQQAEKLKELLVKYKKKEKLPGRVREIIADILNTSPTQVARMESIPKNLTEDFKQEFKEEKVNISTAYEISKLPQDQQEEILKEYEEKGNISIKDVKEKEKFLNWLWDFEFNLFGIPVPDKVFFLNISPEISIKLMEARKNKFTQETQKDIHENDKNHLSDSYKNACELISKYGWDEIVCTRNEELRSIDDIHEEIYKKIKS